MIIVASNTMLAVLADAFSQESCKNSAIVELPRICLSLPLGVVGMCVNLVESDIYYAMLEAWT